MERKTGLAIAGGISLVLVAGAFALAANTGLLSGAPKARPAAKLSPAAAQTRIVTVEVTETPKPADAVEAGRSDQVEVVTVPLPSRNSTSEIGTTSHEPESSDDATEAQHDGGESGDD